MQDNREHHHRRGPAGASRDRTRSLRADDAEITTDQWRSLDATAYRLLCELIGPERTRIHEEVISHALLSQVVNDYPSPIAAPDPDATYNARQAASYLGVSHWILLRDIRRSALPATYDGGTYSIKGADLPSVPGVPPADPPAPTLLIASAAPWARWPTWSLPNAPAPPASGASTH